MPSNVLLRSLSLIQATMPTGHLVISGAIYDGLSGRIELVTAFPPLHYRRSEGPRGAQRPWVHAFGGDGALLMSFAEPPLALGWVIQIARAEDERAAGKLMSALGSGLAGLGELVKPAQIPGAVVSALGSIMEATPEGRVLGTHIGSEVDAADLQRGFEAELSNFKTRIVLAWR